MLSNPFSYQPNYVMLRTLFALLLLLHGLIHLSGFVNQWVIVLGTQMSGKSLIMMSAENSKWMGIQWLLVGLCFFTHFSFLLATDQLVVYDRPFQYSPVAGAYYHLLARRESRHGCECTHRTCAWAGLRSRSI